MEVKKVKLTQVALNERNPRTITEVKLLKLVESILVFPRMMELRPIVIDEAYMALGGNMRLKALTQISTMTAEQIERHLGGLPSFQKKTAGEQAALLDYWKKWIKAPQAHVVQESTLTEDEKKQFIIKDNVSFGTWDWVELGKWDTADLGEWGMDVWTPAPTDWSNDNNTAGGESGGVDGVLPPELQGTDITPDDLPKIEGDDETAYERIIIVYPKERAQEVADLIGLEKIEKVVYSVDEIIK